MTKPTLGIGIAGFGWMGKTHAYAYRSLPFLYTDVPCRTKLVGVCVRREETIDDAVALGEFEFGTIDFGDLLLRDDIDVIHICTPNAQHRDQVIAAVKAGKHVYCDKPLALDADECGQIIEAVRGRDIVTQVALQYRYYPCTMRAKQLIDEGRLGKLLSFRAAYLHASLVDANKPISWRQHPGQGGGALNDLGSHLLDLLGHLVGPFASVSAKRHIHTKQRPDPDPGGTGAMIDVDADDMAMLLLHTAGGAAGTAEMSKLATGVHDELRVELHGDRGALRFNLVYPNNLEFYDLDDPGAPIGGEQGFKRIQTIGHYPPPAGNVLPGRFNIGWVRAHVACLHNFLDAIAGKAAAHPTFEQSAELHHLLDAAHRSAEQGAWVTL